MTMFRATRRSGLSVFEVLSCVVAVLAGVGLGVAYFGVDINQVAYVALEESDLLDQVPEEWRPENPECPDGDCPDATQREAIALAELATERELLLEQFNQKLAEAGLPTTPPLAPQPAIDSEQPTRRYWELVAHFVEQVNALEEQLTALDQAGRHLQMHHLRALTMAHAQDGLAAFDTTEVDRHAYETSARLIAWYRLCEEHSKQGAEVATEMAGGSLSLQEQKAWEQASLHLSKRAELLIRKLEEARAAIAAQHGDDCPVILPRGLANAG